MSLNLKQLEDKLDETLDKETKESLEQYLNLKQTSQLLQQFNDWRRDKNVPNSKEMPSPTEIGIAIDKAIHFIKSFISLQPDCHFQDAETGKWVWAYSKELIEEYLKDKNK